MNNQRITPMIRYLRWGAFFLVVLFPAVMPLALGQRGQRDVTQRTSTVQAPLNLDGATWAITGSLNTARFLHTATVLPNGVVLVAGGQIGRASCRERV